MMRYKLGEIFNLQMGKTPDRHSPKFWNEGTEPWISIADLTKCNKYIENTAEKITATAVDGSGIKIIPKNTVIMSFKLSIGKVAITPKEMYSNEAIMSFIDKGVLKIEPVYLYYLLMHKDWDTGTNKAVMGKTLNKASLSQITVNIHGYSEQLEIIKALDAASSIIAARKQQLTELDNLIKARFVEMFGDPVSNPKDWNVEPLGKRCGIITGNTPPRSEPENYGKYIEWIKSDNINTPFTFITKAQECLSEAGFEKCRFVEAGSILMTCIAGSIDCIGNVAVTDRRVAFNQQINAIVPEQDEVLYLYWLIQISKPMIHRTINMALKGILSKSQLSEIVFPFPPITLQEQFAAFVEQTDKSKVAVQKALDEAQLLFDSLMQKYFG